jgi:hypothetical protein
VPGSVIAGDSCSYLGVPFGNLGFSSGFGVARLWCGRLGLRRRDIPTFEDLQSAICLTKPKNSPICEVCTQKVLDLAFVVFVYGV